MFFRRDAKEAIDHIRGHGPLLQIVFAEKALSCSITLSAGTRLARDMIVSW